MAAKGGGSRLLQDRSYVAVLLSFPVEGGGIPEGRKNVYSDMSVEEIAGRRRERAARRQNAKNDGAHTLGQQARPQTEPLILSPRGEPGRKRYPETHSALCTRSSNVACVEPLPSVRHMLTNSNAHV